MSPQSRKKQIPGTLVLNWQAPDTQASKPLVRRPMTACEACRSAKVKCNGQRTCERCKNRGLRCVYTQPPTLQNESEFGNRNRHGSVGGQSASTVCLSDDQEMSAASLSTNQTTPDPMSVDLMGDTFSISGGCPGGLPLTRTDSGMEHWKEDTFNHALKQFDWVFPDTDFSLNSGQNPGQNGLDFLPNTTEGTSPATNAGYGTSSEPPATGTSRMSPQIPLPSHRCQCRVNMMTHIPKLEAAIQEHPKPKLDKMFKVTGDVIRSCQEATRCGCYIGPVDLVCIMTVFEQTAFCFDFIAKSGFDGTLKMGIGSYSVSITDDASLKRMLVLDLVNQANELLNSVSNLAHDMFVAQSEPGAKRMSRSPACLNQLNLDYVQEATASFKKLFRLITDFFGEKNTKERSSNS